MANKPLISVIIPAHNSAKTIGQAIESMLGQTWRNLEIVVVDDNSTDDTRAAVAAYAKKDARVNYYALPFDDPQRVNRRGRNINAGYMARNYGFDRIKGEYVTFQDADDASLLNRIEMQYELLTKYDAMHVTLDWQKLEDGLVGKKFDAERFMKEHPAVIGPDELSDLARKTKGALAGTAIGRATDFEIKRLRGVNRLFFKSLAPYPGTSNSPLFKREALDKVRFRKLAERVWPSFTGRGADRDFNFQVAETFGKSYVFLLPMYLWRQERQNGNYPYDLGEYIID